MLTILIRVLLLAALAATPLCAKVVRIEVDSRKDILDGRSFGIAGPFEKLAGKIYFAVDPGNSANRIITDIDKAARNEQGLVEFSSDFYIIKPKQMERGNGTVLYEVSNRGGKGMVRYFNRSRGSSDPETEEEFGDGFLMNQGFTLLWLGWQFDPPLREGLLRVYPPIAREVDRSIEGIVRSDFVPNRRESDHSLADRNHIAYPVADPGDTFNTLTVRDSREGDRRVIPRSGWKFARRENDDVVADPTRVYLESGFEPYKVYEVIYKSKDPAVVGVGPAAVRDALSLLKYGSAPALSIPAGAIKVNLGFGISQSGRFLRTFLYYGFNEDEEHRKVFDGVFSHVAGGGRGSFNHRFAQPSRDAHPYINFFYPTDIFPFTDVEQTDPETGLTDGLLTHAGKPALLPKIFYTNSSYEYWGRAASLIHTSVDGKRDAPIMDNVRIYVFAGSQHGPGRFPPARTSGRQASNPNDFPWFLRSLLLSLQSWTGDDDAPPPSQYPRIDNGSLMTPEELRFPKIPGVTYSTNIHKAYRADYGPRFRTEGIVTQEPPKLGPAFPMMACQVDEDGNEIAGLRMPEQIVPLATYTGWNLFNRQSGPEGVLSNMQGSYIPFSLSRDARQRSGDPRRSIEERYGSREQYLGLVAGATMELIEGGYLLRRDMAEIVKQAGRHWDYLHTGK